MKLQSLSRVLAVAALAILSACGNQTYIGVPPNYIGMMLTPTGYEDKVYTPGQVDIGAQRQSGMGNQLVLIQRSGLQVKEAFVGAAASSDKEDHRCVSADGLPFTIDVRLLLAIPNYETPAGQVDLKRLFLLGNPQAKDGNARVLTLDAKSIYNEQAQADVRGRIRQVCRQLANYKAAFAAFGAEGDASLSRRFEKEVAAVLKMKSIPLGIVNVEVSNLKPDQAVMDALVQQAAVQEQQTAISNMVNYLSGDPMRLEVYRIQVGREVAMKATTVIYNQSSGNIVPVPRAVAAAPAPAVEAKK